MHTTLPTVVGVACAGALGAPARFLVDRLVSLRTRGVFPWGTLVVNLSAAFLLGVLAAFFQAHLGIPAWLGTTLETGLIGTYSTFSTLTLETANLFQSGAYLLGAANITGSIVLGLLAVYGGTVVGHAI